MLCCGRCFGDRGLRRQIIPQRSVKTGNCPQCGALDEPLLEARELGEYFGPITAIYAPAEDGRLLIEWLIDDWALFPPERLTTVHANAILAEILDDGEVVRQRFKPIAASMPDHLDGWNKLRDELMHTNRFFPDTEFDAERLVELLSSLIMDSVDVSTTWYRARVEKEERRYRPEEMGAPPGALASHGRANPAGIPYLYLGSATDTACAEVRPHPGERISIGEFTVAPKALILVDLRNPKVTASPFLIGDEDALALLRVDLIFLERLGEELKTPVLPATAAIAYIPSQYLCEFIKKAGYDGVVYGSSVSSGMNVALFYPHKATVGKVEEYVVTSVDVKMQVVG